EELQEYEEKVLRAEERIAELEKDLFDQVRKTIAGQAGRIQATARLLGELDVYASLAEVAIKNDYVRPQLVESDEICVQQGRHPVVEFQSRPFIANEIGRAACRERVEITGVGLGTS